MEIKAQQFIKEPKVEALKNTVLIYGNDDLLKDLVLDKIKERGSTLTLWGDEAQFVELINHIKTKSLFGVQPWVVIRDAHQFVVKLKKDEVEQLLSQLKQLKEQKVIFVFREQELPKLDFYKKLTEISDVVVCPRLTKQAFLTSIRKKIEREGLKIDDENLVYLASLLNYDLTAAKQEIEKLIVYCKDKGDISKEDIDSLVVSISESNVFEFLEKFFNKDRDSLLIAQKLIGKDVHPFQIQTLLVNQIEKVFYFKVLVSNGVSYDEAFRRVKATNNLQKANIQRYAKMLSIDELERLLKLLYHLEINQKVYYKDIEKEFLNFLILFISGEKVEPQTFEA